jgi:ATP-dependent DNA helicase RecG
MATLTRLAGLSVGEVKGLGGKRSEALSKAGIATVADLLHHVPHRYIDRSKHSWIESTPLGEEVTVIGTVSSQNLRRPRRNLTILDVFIADGSGSIKGVFFNQGFRAKQLSVGTQVAFSGVVTLRGRERQISNPAVDVLDSASDSEQMVTGRVVPIHSSVGKISAAIMRTAVHNAVIRSRPIEDPIPAELVAQHNLVTRDKAFADIHFPEEMADIKPARTRLVYDELFRLELALALKQLQYIKDSNGIAHQPTGELVEAFLIGLPYTLTADQSKALATIDKDLRNQTPMHRLLQGEVGSGKTVVAVAAMLSVIESGYQTAVMAPTEVLAGQHFLSIVDLLALAGMSPEIRGLGSELGMMSLFEDDGPAVHVALLTGSTAVTNYRSSVTRSQLLEDVESGQIDLLIGTHALIQEGVNFKNLGAAVVDEQHRFGVSQRVSLKAKAGLDDPDLLIMTATPIPRTMSMTMYGDLEVTEIKEMPPGRTPVDTEHLSKNEESVAWSLVRRQVDEGRQAFVVCPLVEDSAKIEAVSASAEFERISAIMPELRVGLIHGQMKSIDKEAAMSAFRDGAVDVLVATTVIEVGIDVPNATVMVIEDADRFGLSQLHQLRGRVGRGAFPGRCILLADPTTEDGEQRIAAMVDTTDGFELANTDLRIRGQGTVFGTKQSGLTDLKLSNVLRDYSILKKARRDAFALVRSDPELVDHAELAAEVRAMLGGNAEWLFVS